MKKLFLAFASVWGLLGVSCGNSSAQVSGAGLDSVSDVKVSTGDSISSLSKADTLTLSFVGDIMMGTTFPDSINGTHLPANDGKNLFDECKEIFQRVDVACGNLEGSLLDGSGHRRPMRNPKTYFVFRMPTRYATNLTDAGFDFVGIANNHINDFGEPGRRSTMATLNDVALPHAGLKGRCEIAVLERNGLRVALTQFGHGANNLNVTDLAEVRRVVKQMRDSADIIVVSFHGGAEGASHIHVPHRTENFLGENRGNVEAFAHAAIDAGADVVFGQGPHVPRAAELYKDHIIFYSMGNFCTPYRMGISGVNGYAPVAEVAIDSHSGKFIGGKIHSFIQQRGRGPKYDPSNSAARHIKRMSEEDFPTSPLLIAPDGTLSVR